MAGKSKGGSMSEFAETLEQVLKLIAIFGAGFIVGMVYWDSKMDAKITEHRKLQKKYVYPRLSK